MNNSNQERSGIQGWEQFLANKQDMLYQFEVAKKYADSHIVKVSHGNVAEAVFRKWLSMFLPEKYGVTSGYIVSQSNASINLKLPHYDVIVYDKLNSPVLWVEKSPDSTESGRARAIPAEYVRSVIEVKSNLTVKSSKESLEKIYELKSLLRGVRSKTENDGLLHEYFVSMCVFFELEKSNEHKKDILNNLVCSMDMPHYGGVILSAEVREIYDTGLFKTFIGESQTISTVDKSQESLISGSPISDSVITKDLRHAGAFLSWSPANFSFFAFDLIAMLEGKYQLGNISSMYGVSWFNPNKRT